MPKTRQETSESEMSSCDYEFNHESDINTDKFVLFLEYDRALMADWKKNAKYYSRTFRDQIWQIVTEKHIELNDEKFIDLQLQFNLKELLHNAFDSYYEQFKKDEDLNFIEIKVKISKTEGKEGRDQFTVKVSDRGDGFAGLKPGKRYPYNKIKPKSTKMFGTPSIGGMGKGLKMLHEEGCSRYSGSVFIENRSKTSGTKVSFTFFSQEPAELKSHIVIKPRTTERRCCNLF